MLDKSLYLGIIDLPTNRKGKNRMTGLTFEEFSDSKKRNEFNNPLVYLPSRKDSPLVVTILADPVNQPATAAQLETGKMPGLLMYRWSGYQDVAYSQMIGKFTNSRGQDVTPRSTPSLFANHSVDDDGRPIFLEKRAKDIRNNLLYETHKDIGTFLKRNPQFWPACYTDAFKDDWDIKPVLALRVFVHDENNNPIEEERVLVVDGGFFKVTIEELNKASEYSIPNFAMRRAKFSRVPDGGKTKASVTINPNAKLTDTKEYAHLSSYQYKHSLNVGDDRVFYADNFDVQREYLLNMFNMTIPSAQEIIDGTAAGTYK